MTDEVRLEGGSMTHVVRVGDSVRSRGDPLSALVASAYPRKLLDSRPQGPRAGFPLLPRLGTLLYASTVRSSGMISPTLHTTPCSPKRALAPPGVETRGPTQTCKPDGTM